MSGTKPLASLSLDLDNQWSYMKTHGDPGWQSFPSYLGTFVPYVLEVLEKHELKITFFIVGQDAALDRNRDVLGMIPAQGHEVGNHSFHHEPWIHRLSRKEVEREIGESEGHIFRATGVKPVGFRGPGFSWSGDLFEVLAERDYLFDASTLPTYIGPFARAYYFRTAGLTQQERTQRADLFGKFKDGLRPIKAYSWRLHSGKTLLEIPVSTIPGLKLPFHLSYLIYLSRISVALMTAYLKAALRLCRLTKTEPSFLLHPLDLIGAEHLPELAFFPGMDLSGARKIKLFSKVVAMVAREFEFVRMDVHAQSILKRGNLKEFSPELARS
jgi:hypothetical protein